MNERIKKLADQALDATVPQTWTTLTAYDLAKFTEKFSELIVQECAKVAWYHTPDTEELEYSHLIKDKLLEYFGVEE